MHCLLHKDIPKDRKHSDWSGQKFSVQKIVILVIVKHAPIWKCLAGPIEKYMELWQCIVGAIDEYMELQLLVGIILSSNILLLLNNFYVPLQC